jgi:hypothetical protein
MAMTVFRFKPGKNVPGMSCQGPNKARIRRSPFKVQPVPGGRLGEPARAVLCGSGRIQELAGVYF